jgi:putative PEP-CTERM system histidine kinase
MSFTSLLPFASAGVGTMLVIVTLARAPRTVADWMFACGMAVLSAEALLTSGAAPISDFFGDEVQLSFMRFVALSFLPGFWVLFSLSYARGNAAETLRKRQLWLALVFVGPLVLCFAFGAHQGGATAATIDKPASLFHLGWAGWLIYFSCLITAVAVLMNLERTFRASVGTMRWRIKFMLLGVGLLFVTRLYTTSQVLLFGTVELSLEALNSAALLLGGLLMIRSIFRTGKFTLDVYPSESVLQGSLTVLLTGVYLLIVGLFAKIVGYFGGDTSFALKAFIVLVALVLAAIVLQSDRARLFLRRFVSRNFQRPLYDYRTVWRKFTEATASRVEQSDLCRALVRLMAEMFQSLSVSIWVLDPKKQTFILGASTSVSEATARGMEPAKNESAAILAYFEAHTEPVDIEPLNAPWASTIQHLHPTVFPKGGHRICLPLSGRGQLLGLIVLGDRVAGAPFSVQDFDMLKCVGDHAAANLFNVQLSQKLLQARELEAFQTMATFFVHDLKNAASTLKLMLQNLPVHFDDPEFRADALRGTAKTVAHIDHLIGRLSSLRHELKIEPAPADLNEIADNIVARLEKGSGVRLIKEFADLPKIRMDREQITKVITNLILNAVEASPKNGPVQLNTSQRDGWAVLSVTDSGCGMSAEFMNNSLFRPFQTTKKGGLGIGMFQSKLIVEAHAGRISVVSQPEIGTTFEISLPVSKT